MDSWNMDFLNSTLLTPDLPSDTDLFFGIGDFPLSDSPPNHLSFDSICMSALDKELSCSPSTDSGKGDSEDSESIIQRGEPENLESIIQREESDDSESIVHRGELEISEPINKGESKDSKLEQQPPKKKHRKNQPPDAEHLPPCRVCGEKASGLHYGANTCEPCKGFFRRSIVKIEKKNEKYVCAKGDGSCKLGTGKRTMCSYCRYKKCLDVGMAHGAIKIGRYTHEKRTKDITEVRKLKLKENQTVDTTSIDVTEQEVDELVARLIVIQEEFCADFRKSFEPGGLLEKHTFVYERFKEKMETFGNLSPVPWSTYNEFLSATGLELDDRKSRMNLIAARMEQAVRNMVTFARNIPGFSDLQTPDQLDLLKVSRVKEHQFFDLFLEYVVCAVFRPFNNEICFDMYTLVYIFPGPLEVKYLDRCVLQEPEKVDRTSMKFSQLFTLHAKKKA
ncbi:Hypothetical predicted protein [Mytilus galloprovincialis]|uniref:Nuclear receptor domain-containing protein n=1 Tax=Mytilus galloprovincialis TaxID=29158 RepID=A0A8B6E3A0_MYTGA|nr:Hypothetical predicted protein [Mytilus galloprovincialis]